MLSCAGTALLLLLTMFQPATQDGRVRLLLQKVQAHQQEIDRQLESYGYTQTLRKEEDGKQKTLEVSEIMFDHKRKISHLLSRNGKPLQGADQEKEQKRVERQLRDLEAGKAPQLSSKRVRLEDLMRTTLITGVKTTTLGGRDVWYAEFHPDPKAKPANMTERFAHSLDGKIWIDEQALQIAQLEFVLREPFKVGGGLVFSMKPGTRFLEERTWSFSKIWLPKSRRLEMSGKALMGIKLNVLETTSFSDFHEFNVDVKDSVSSGAPAAIH